MPVTTEDTLRQASPVPAQLRVAASSLRRDDADAASLMRLAATLICDLITLVEALDRQCDNLAG